MAQLAKLLLYGLDHSTHIETLYGRQHMCPCNCSAERGAIGMQKLADLWNLLASQLRFSVFKIWV